MIYTYHKNHEKASASRDTWLPRCDGAVIASDLDDAAIGAVNIPHEGPEEWKNIWQKTRANWRYVYEHYSADFDFFLFGGDDMYVLVENLRAYLRTDEFTRARIDNGEPLYLGRRFKQNGNWEKLFP